MADDLSTITLNSKGKVTYASYSTTVPLKGTALYEYSLERGLIDPESHTNDMAGCTDISTLRGWSQREKEIRYNIFLVGAIIAKLPFPFGWLATQVIKVVPPNRLFVKLRQTYYRYSIENRIFNLHWRERQSPGKVRHSVPEPRQHSLGERQSRSHREEIIPLAGRGSSRDRTAERVLCSKEEEY